MKLFLSNSGIYTASKYQFSDAKSNLTSAKNNTGGSPNSFSYASYVNSSLPNLIGTYLKDLEKIEDMADKAEKRYDELNTSGKTMFDNVSEYTIKEREGLKAKVDLEQQYSIGDTSMSEGKAINYSDSQIQFEKAQGPLGEHSISNEGAVTTNGTVVPPTSATSPSGVASVTDSNVSSTPETSNTSGVSSSEQNSASPQVNSINTPTPGISIPSSVKQTGITKNYTNYDYFYNRWSNNTNQRVMADRWGEAGKTSNNGIATLDDRYLVAVSQKFGNVGDNIDVVLEDGTVINCTIADAKGSDATSEWGHVLSNGGVDVIEWESVGNQDVIQIDDWKGKTVSSIINLNNQT